jgi:hypothetical protein
MGNDLGLTGEELHLLKQLNVAGDVGRRVTATRTHERLDRLRKAGFVTGTEGGDKSVLYRITRTGSDAVLIATL